MNVYESVCMRERERKKKREMETEFIDPVCILIKDVVKKIEKQILVSYYL